MRRILFTTEHNPIIVIFPDTIRHTHTHTSHNGRTLVKRHRLLLLYNYYVCQPSSLPLPTPSSQFRGRKFLGNLGARSIFSAIPSSKDVSQQLARQTKTYVVWVCLSVLCSSYKCNDRGGAPSFAAFSVSF